MKSCTLRLHTLLVQKLLDLLSLLFVDGCLRKFDASYFFLAPALAPAAPPALPATLAAAFLSTSLITPTATV